MTTENNGTGAESQQAAPEAVNTDPTQPESQQTETREPPQEESKPEAAQKVVPLAALHEERNERKRLQQEMTRMRQEQAQRDEVINRRLAQLVPKQAEPQAPDPTENPVGYIDHRIGEVRQALQPLVDGQHQQMQQRQHEEQVRHLASRVQMSEATIRQTVPDYDDAVNHLAKVRAAELEVFGLSREQIMQQLGQETQRMALQWAHQGLNPAEVAYNLARARGYTPKAQQQQAQQAAQQQSAEEKITAQQRGTQAARSLGNGGGVSTGKLTAQALANMSNEDFAKLSESQWRQAMGE